MKTILITGGIGAGKSEARKWVERKGFRTYDCDSRCKALYDSVPGLKKKIEEALGLPFSEIGVIFRNPEAMSKLEALVFPLLVNDILKWKKEAEGTAVAFIESATALEKKALDGIYDYVWLLEAPECLRLERNPKTAERAGLQHFDRSVADEVIENDGSIEDLHGKLDKILLKYETEHKNL